MKIQEGTLENSNTKGKAQNTRATEKEQGNRSVGTTTKTAKTSATVKATGGTMTEPVAGKESEKEPKKGSGNRTSEKQSSKKPSGGSKARTQENQPKASPAKSIKAVDTVASSATANSVMAGEGEFVETPSVGKQHTGGGETILASPGNSAGNNNPTGENGNATGSSKVQARLYECRALCFVGERLWKPGEKQYSAVSLDALHWELVTEETE